MPSPTYTYATTTLAELKATVTLNAQDGRYLVCALPVAGSAPSEFVLVFAAPPPPPVPE